MSFMMSRTDTFLPLYIKPDSSARIRDLDDRMLSLNEEVQKANAPDASGLKNQ